MENNIYGHGGQGIQVYSANDTIVVGNNITENYKGITVVESRNVTICGNNISHNTYGLNLEWWGPYDVYENNIKRFRGYALEGNAGIRKLLGPFAPVYTRIDYALVRIDLCLENAFQTLPDFCYTSDNNTSTK